MTNQLSNYLLYFALILFIFMPAESVAVKPVEEKKTLEEEFKSKQGLNFIEKVLLRKIQKKIDKKSGEVSELEDGHWSLILSLGSILSLLLVPLIGGVVTSPYIILALSLISFFAAIIAIYFGLSSRRDKKNGLEKKGYAAGLIGTILGFMVLATYVLSVLITLIALILVLLSL